MPAELALKSKETSPVLKPRRVRRGIKETARPLVALIHPPSFRRLSRAIKKERFLSLDLGSLPETTVIFGDSMCFVDGFRDDLTGYHQVKSFGHMFSHQLQQDGIPMKTYNFAVPGSETCDVLDMLRQQDVRQTFLSAKNPLVVLSLSGNDFRYFVDNPKIQRDLEDIQHPTLKTFLRMPSLAIRLSRRYAKTANRLGDKVFQVLQEIDALNSERREMGNGDIKGLVVTLPPDFSLSPQVEFIPAAGAPSDIAIKQFDGNNRTVKNISRAGAFSVSEQTLAAYNIFKRKKGDYPTAILPMHEYVEAKHFTRGDQHVDESGQDAIARGLTKSIFYKTIISPVQ